MATIEIDGKTFDVEHGKMIIEVADEAGIHIPRFCYHKKLSVAANCRMCLVSLENSRKTVPACATPITDGMKIFTQSPEAIRSQQAVIEFLLINHPLDCPICDQGGECELQDVSMGYGQDTTVYTEEKRAVADDDLGSLVATEMTRCIQCTRCVRFGDEVAGLRELGCVDRGESMRISTYVEHSLKSEISGNIIDLCPVGALTSKPYRFTARAWEMTQQPSIAPHDCLGSPIYIHTRRDKVMRVVPREQENTNETWLSDRDRFSYLGLNSEKRALSPMIKQHGQWHTVDWQTALDFASKGLQRVIETHGVDQVAALASSSLTTEELYLLQKLMRSLDIPHVDHRLQQTDFRDEVLRPLMPTNTLAYAELEHQAEIMVFGCQVVREVPLAGVRLRKAQRNGAHIYTINPVQDDLCVTVAEALLVAVQDMPMKLASVLLALLNQVSDVPQELQALLIGLVPDEATCRIAAALKKSKSAIVTGALFENHPEAALLRTLMSWITQLSGARHVHLTTGANAAGAWAAGMVPHRSVAGGAVVTTGLDAQAALDAKLKGYVLMGIEPSFDVANPYRARQSMLAAEFVVVMTSFMNESALDFADVILPMALFAETSGTYVNVDHTWQTFAGAVPPPGLARPGWKILRVLGNMLHVNGFDYTSSTEVLNEIESAMAISREIKSSCYYPESLPVSRHPLIRLGEWPLYRTDALVRHAMALQQCAAADKPVVRMNSKTADSLQLGETATVSQGDIEITLPLKRDDAIAEDVVWVANAIPETMDLGGAFASITIKR